MSNEIVTTSRIYLKKVPPELNAEMSGIGDLLANDDSDEELMNASEITDKVNGIRK